MFAIPKREVNFNFVTSCKHACSVECSEQGPLNACHIKLFNVEHFLDLI